MTAGVVLIYAAASVVVTNAEGGRPVICVSRSARDFSETLLRMDLVGMSVSLKGLGRHPNYTNSPPPQGGGKSYRLLEQESWPTRAGHWGRPLVGEGRVR